MDVNALQHISLHSHGPNRLRRLSSIWKYVARATLTATFSPHAVPLPPRPPPQPPLLRSAWSRVVQTACDSPSPAPSRRWVSSLLWPGLRRAERASTRVRPRPPAPRRRPSRALVATPATRSTCQVLPYRPRPVPEPARRGTSQGQTARRRWPPGPSH